LFHTFVAPLLLSSQRQEVTIVSALIAASAGFLLASVIFVVIGLRYRDQVRSIHSYFVFPRSANARLLFSSLMGGGLSIASAILVFIEWSSTPGIGVAAVFSPLFWSLGVWILLLFFNRLWPYLEQGHTLHSFLSHHYDSRLIQRVAAIATITGFLGQFGVEILFTTKIVMISLNSDSHAASLMIGGAILLVVVTYSWMGGFLSIMKSDRIHYQIALIGLGLALIYVLTTNVSSIFQQLHDSLTHDLTQPSFGPTPLISWLVVISLFCLNWPLLLTDISVWQRLSGAASKTDAQNAIRSFVGGIVLLGCAIILFGIALQAPDTIPGTTSDPYLPRLVQFISGSWVIAALFFAGIFSAAMTTADTLLLAAAQAWMADVRQTVTASPSPSEDSTAVAKGAASEADMLSKARRTTLLIAVIAFGTCYFISTRGVDYISILFVVFSAQVSLTPPVLLGLLRGTPETHGSLKVYRNKAFGSVACGYGTAIMLLIAYGILDASVESGAVAIDLSVMKISMLYLSPLYVLTISFIAFLMLPRVNPGR